MKYRIQYEYVSIFGVFRLQKPTPQQLKKVFVPQKKRNFDYNFFFYIKIKQYLFIQINREHHSISLKT